MLKSERITCRKRFAINVKGFAHLDCFQRIAKKAGSILAVTGPTFLRQFRSALMEVLFDAGFQLQEFTSAAFNRRGLKMLRQINAAWSVALLMTLLNAGLLAQTAWSQDSKTAKSEKPEETEEEKIAKRRAKWMPKEPQEGFQQYRVKISVAFDNDPRFTDIYRTHMLSEIERVADRSFGLMWQLTVEDNNWLMPARENVLARLRATDVQAAQTGDDFDKVIVVTIQGDGVRYRASAREWDANGAGRMLSNNDGPREWDERGRVLSPLETAETTDRRDVAEAAGQAIIKAFRPTLTVESGDGDKLILRLKAGEYPAPDPAARQIIKGDILLPYFRFRNKKMELQMVQFLPATYIVVQEVKRSVIHGVIVSALGMRIQGGKKRRLEQMCIRERPRHASTDVQLVLRKNTKRLLIANRVRVIPKLRGNEEQMAEPDEVWSDRDGVIPVKVPSVHSLVWLYIHSGKQLVSRVPFAPGLVARQRIELLDDGLRLGVEGELTILQGRLVDTVARQAVLKAFIKKASDAGDWDKADKEVEKLKKLMPVSDFRGELSRIQTTALVEADRIKDRIARSRISRLCSETEQLIARYLDQEKMKIYLESIESLRDAGEEPEDPTKPTKPIEI